MSQYTFRLRFFLSPATEIGVDDNRHEFEVPSLDTPLELRSYDESQSISESDHLVLEGAEYDTEDVAHKIGKRASEALLWCGLREGYGVDLGDEPSSGGLTKYVRKKIKQQTGARVLKDVQGLRVYECDEPTLFDRVNATLTATHDGNQFRTDFTEFVDADVELDPSVSLALELASLAYFEKSSRAQFLTRMLAVETVLPDIPASDEAQTLVDAFISAIKCADLGEDEADSLEGWASHMKYQSISRTGQKLAREHLSGEQYDGEAAEDFFKTAYDARSSLVHAGEIPDGDPDVGALNTAVRGFVQDLLEAIIMDRNPELA